MVSNLVEGFVPFLIEWGVKGTVVLATGGLVSVLMRRRRAAERHALWAAVLAGVLIVPLLGLVLPGLHLPERSVAIADLVVRPLVEHSAVESFVVSPIEPLKTVNTVMPLAAASAVSRDNTFSLNISILMVVAWMLGAALVAGRYGLGAARFLVAARRAAALDTSTLPAGFQSQVLAARLDGRLRVTVAHNETMPMTWGWRRPVILLPAAAKVWGVDRLDVVLMHELGHVIRRDALTQAIGQLVCALMWFHPLVWLAASRMRLEAEQATDDFVLAAGSRASDYAEHLLDVARSTLAASAWGAVAIARESSLGSRIKYLLDDRRLRGGPARLAIALTLGLIAAVAMPIAALRMQAQERVEESAVAAVDPVQAAPVVAASTAVVLAQAQPEPQARPRPVRPAIPARPARPARERANENPLPPETMRAVVTALTEALKSSDADVRKEAAEALGHAGRGHPEAIDALVVAMEDADPRVQREVLDSLGMLIRGSDKASNAVTGIVRMLQHNDKGVRKEAAQALGQAGVANPTVIEALSRALDDSEASVRNEAMDSLGRLARNENVSAGDAVVIIGKGLRSSDAKVRKEAVEALGKLHKGAAEAAPLLIEATKDSDPAVQKEAVEALGNLTGRRRSSRSGFDFDFDFDFEFDFDGFKGMGPGVGHSIQEMVEGQLAGALRQITVARDLWNQTKLG
jgi:beta-lactamase regulating signal transducer with metallopeptidase domain